ncbi:hypothetical protein DAKH74_004130 [Maudiozyma humilis]|uniref:Uncharacterized protein n=1 Tax=Maudiozyma humilis TaxID=51915 RepID=A0AAV5RSV2_MAUHU|nr:hypothetical protein DAKH74_004130 [Kazachstania humilis]
MTCQESERPTAKHAASEDSKKGRRHKPRNSDNTSSDEDEEEMRVYDISYTMFPISWVDIGDPYIEKREKLQEPHDSEYEWKMLERCVDQNTTQAARPHTRNGTTRMREQCKTEISRYSSKHCNNEIADSKYKNLSEEMKSQTLSGNFENCGNRTIEERDDERTGRTYNKFNKGDNKEMCHESSLEKVTAAPKEYDHRNPRYTPEQSSKKTEPRLSKQRSRKGTIPTSVKNHKGKKSLTANRHIEETTKDTSNGTINQNKKSKSDGHSMEESNSWSDEHHEERIKRTSEPPIKREIAQTSGQVSLKVVTEPNITQNNDRDIDQVSNEHTNKNTKHPHGPYNSEEVREFMNQQYKKYESDPTVMVYDSLSGETYSGAGWSTMTKRKIPPRKYGCLQEVANLLASQRES